MRRVLAVTALLLCQSVLAGDIGFGTIKGIKVYDFSGNKLTKKYLSDDATMKTVTSCECVEHYA